PRDGFCSIDPKHGTVLTLFTINCSNWFDEDGIKDISVYGKVFSSGRKIYSQRRMLLTSSTNSIISLRLPTNVDLLVQIRDTFGCITEVDLTPVTITSNSSLIGALFEEKSNIESNIIPLSELLNEISRNTVDEISVTPFHPDLSNLMKNQSHVFNITTLNQHANIREELMMIISNLSLTTFNDVKLQSSMISILTETTNQLTRKTLINALNKSSQLSFFLQSYKNKLAYEDTHFIAMHILESVTNIHTGINGPLQQRMQVLQFDLEDFSFTGEHDLHHSNFEYQKQLVRQTALPCSSHTRTLL
ncbi:unnamed protein product, partial [Adineta ricciae]